MAGKEAETQGMPSWGPAALAMAGYGLDIALVSLAGWPGSSSAFSSGPFSADAGSIFMQVKSAAFCLSFFAWFALALCGDARVQRLVERPWACWVFSALYVLGSLGSLAAVPASLVGVAEVACGLLMGVALSGNFMLWVSLFSAHETPLDARCVIGGTMLGGLMYFMLAWLPSTAICVLSMVLIAPGTSLVLMVCVHRACASDGTRPVESAAVPEPSGPEEMALLGGKVRFPLDRPSRRANLKLGILALLTPHLAIGAIGASMQMARLLLVGLGSSEVMLGNANNLGLVASGVVALLLFERSRYHVDMTVFTRVCAPLIALAALGLPLFGGIYGYIYSFALYTVFSWASIVGILACNQVARHFHIPPVAMYSLMFFIIYTMRYLPSFFASTFSLLEAPGLVQSLVCTLVCVSMMFCAYVVSDRYRSRQEAAQVFSWESQLEVPQVVHVVESVGDVAVRLGERNGLTTRETDVLVLLARGRSVPVIAATLGVSQNTVRFHCKNVYEKLGVHSRQELLAQVDGEVGGDAEQAPSATCAT